MSEEVRGFYFQMLIFGRRLAVYKTTLGCRCAFVSKYGVHYGTYSEAAEIGEKYGLIYG
jgi:hypothetical protein